MSDHVMIMSFCCKPLRKMVRHGSTLDSFHPNQPVAYHGSLAVTSYPSFSDRGSPLGRAAAQPGVASAWGIGYPTLWPSYLGCAWKILINYDKL